MKRSIGDHVVRMSDVTVPHECPLIISAALIVHGGGSM